ncbi:mapk-regulated corepressor-interacting protein 1-like [Saccostrea echinata]|uniref:mapk-regulated corepressor-interacting protein 1-like n=1 Tax=Saccostrea echinata TaxID=191078 RepID=UPI002A7F3DF7|nr:mapk-regulated corepressor-interacting protein 1-like [Saccostrea echinata]
MYALQRGPSKLVASTRRGPSKSLNNLEKKDQEKDSSEDSNMSSPKPTFNYNQHHVNGKRGFSRSNSSSSAEAMTPQHEEIVRYLYDAWVKVNNELEACSRNQREGGPIVYRDKNPNNPTLVNFKPFDLESYWGDRQLNSLNIQK